MEHHFCREFLELSQQQISLDERYCAVGTGIPYFPWTLSVLCAFSHIIHMAESKSLM